MTCGAYSMRVIYRAMVLLARIYNGTFINDKAHEIMVFFVRNKLILQMRMRSHSMGLDVWFLVGPFIYFHSLCVRTAKALVRLRGCAGSHEPSLFAYVIRTIISWAGSNVFFNINRFCHLSPSDCQMCDECCLRIVFGFLTHLSR